MEKPLSGTFFISGKKEVKNDDPDTDYLKLLCAHISSAKQVMRPSSKISQLPWHMASSLRIQHWL
jgi:hypothetical protein